METLVSARKERAIGTKMLQASCSRLKYWTSEKVMPDLISPPIKTNVTTVANKINLSVKTISAVENPLIIDVRVMNLISILWKNKKPCFRFKKRNKVTLVINAYNFSYFSMMMILKCDEMWLTSCEMRVAIKMQLLSLLAQRVHQLLKRFFPGVHLDDLHSTDELSHHPHPLVRAFCYLSSQSSLLGAEVGWNNNFKRYRVPNVCFLYVICATSNTEWIQNHDKCDDFYWGKSPEKCLPFP